MDRLYSPADVARYAVIARKARELFGIEIIPSDLHAPVFTDEQFSAIVAAIRADGDGS